jgi:hypothetical protein
MTLATRRQYRGARGRRRLPCGPPSRGVAAVVSRGAAVSLPLPLCRSQSSGSPRSGPSGRFLFSREGFGGPWGVGKLSGGFPRDHGLATHAISFPLGRQIPLQTRFSRRRCPSMSGPQTLFVGRI